MNRLFLLAPVLALLIACGDDAKFNEASVGKIKPYIYVSSDNIPGEPYEYGSYRKNVYLEQDHSAKLWAVYAYNGTFVPTKSIDDYIAGKAWDVDGEYFNATYFRHSFDTPGKKQVILTSTDYFNDDVSDTISIYVNTPLSIELTEPKDSSLLVDPVADEGVSFAWNVTGVDPWESTICNVYVAANRDEVWDNLLGYTDCSDLPTIEGPLFPDISADSSVTVYWAVTAISYTNDGFQEQKSSAIHQFSTKFRDAQLAHILVPILYDYSWGIDSAHTKISIITSEGDTLDTYENYLTNTVFDYWAEPQDSLRLVFTEERRREFKEQSLTIDVPGTTEIRTDTIRFNDLTNPQVDVLKHSFPIDSAIQFLAIDNGTGINPNSIRIVHASDTLQFIYSDPVISFTNICPLTCYVSVNVADNAGNRNSAVSWKIDSDVDSIYVTGPYTKVGQ